MEGDGRGGAGGVSAKEDAVVVDGQLTEDEKMEKFYELIRNYKQARERRRIELERTSEAGEDGEDEGTRKRRKTRKMGDRAASSWIPAFKWEDFREDCQIQFQRSPVIFPTSFNDVHGGHRIGRRDDPPLSDVDDGGLDLRLRL